jgi:hypothetical protein
VIQWSKKTNQDNRCLLRLPHSNWSHYTGWPLRRKPDFTGTLIRLLLAGFLEHFGYHQFHLFSRLAGIYDLLVHGKIAYGYRERSAYKTQTAEGDKKKAQTDDVLNGSKSKRLIKYEPFALGKTYKHRVGNGRYKQFFNMNCYFTAISFPVFGLASSLGTITFNTPLS